MKYSIIFFLAVYFVHSTFSTTNHLIDLQPVNISNDFQVDETKGNNGTVGINLDIFTQIL